MTQELVQSIAGRLPPVPWRDPHTVSQVRLAEYIRTLEAACEREAASALAVGDAAS